MDSMANTSSTGANWMVLEYTVYTCDVFPYKDGYEATKDVPIATCGTLVQGKSGTDFIFIGHETL